MDSLRLHMKRIDTDIGEAQMARKITLIKKRERETGSRNHSFVSACITDPRPQALCVSQIGQRAGPRIAVVRGTGMAVGSSASAS